ncbi:hypothetical protein DFH07DRAFT_1011371 [Mycena maculata]|uniref:Uncharacterized protein n=1 Tax=Mycena maculata TaxID=230809 RepID=A0AAD7JLM1_9AGAR|nr:hypothetical protein DFH07DRAFT_1011371 [Mycena maculata]
MCRNHFKFLQGLDETIRKNESDAPRRGVPRKSLRYDNRRGGSRRTRFGTSGLVAPHKYVSSSGDSVLNKYAAEYRDTSEDSSCTSSSSQIMCTDHPGPEHLFFRRNCGWEI